MLCYASLKNINLFSMFYKRDGNLIHFTYKYGAYYMVIRLILHGESNQITGDL